MRTGDLVVKLAGRDAGKRAVVLNVVDNVRALIDGETRRKEVSLKHIEPLQRTLSLNEDASHAEVKSAFKIELGIDLKESKPKKSTPRQKKKHKVRQKPVKAVKQKIVAKPEAQKKAPEKKL